MQTEIARPYIKSTNTMKNRLRPRFCRYAVLEHRGAKEYFVNDAYAQASEFSGRVILRAEIYTL